VPKKRVKNPLKTDISNPNIGKTLLKIAKLTMKLSEENLYHEDTKTQRIINENNISSLIKKVTVQTSL
jgi:hypothetical protein